MTLEEKAGLRRNMHEKLLAIDQAEVARWTNVINVRLVEEVIPESARTIMLYLAQDRELNLDPAIERLLSMGRTVAIPGVDDTGSGMRPIQLDTLSPSALHVDRFGIRVPLKRHAIDPNELDVVVVPGVAFGYSGARLGRGGGFYDRFLKSLPEATMRVGACFKMQLIDAVPTLPHDHPMGLVVTEDGAHSAKN